MAEAQFQPKWDEKTLRGIIKQYKNNPKAFSEPFKQSIEQHASYHNVPFYSGEFGIADAITDFGAGFMEGFTTLHFGEEPDNEYEAIFKNLGHLAGFAPGIISAPLMGLHKITKAQSLLTAANMARTLNDKSIPMAAAKIATNFAKKSVKPFLARGRLAKHSAVKTASDFILGNKARHIAEGAFHLGAASAVSSWQGGVDQMMSSFVQGGIAGGGFRSIGNFIKTGNEAGNKVARTLAGSLFMGLPSTIQGATTPEQVYQYTMGAWFGGNERPWTVAKGQKYMQEFVKDAKDNPQLLTAMDPMESPKWKKLPEEAKEVTKELFKNRWGDPEENRAAVWTWAQKHGIDVAKAAEVAKDLGDYYEVAGPEGKKIKLKPGALAGFENFVITSGQPGIESFIAREGHKRKDRIATVNMVTPEERNKIKKKVTPGVAHKLTPNELSQANVALVRASNILGKQPEGKTSDMVRKNYFVVKNSDALYLSGEFRTMTLKSGKVIVSKNMLQGAPGWAAQMAIDMNKPVYLYEHNQNKWFKYMPSAKGFTPKAPEKPPKAMGFISDYKNKVETKRAFADLFETHFPEVIAKKDIDSSKKTEKDDKGLNQVDDTDVGSLATDDKEIGINPFKFVRRYMKNLKAYEGLVGPIKESKMIEDMNKISEIFPKYHNPGEKVNRSKEFLKELEKTFDIKLSPEERADAEGFTRQWISRRNNDRNLIQFTSDGERIYMMDDKYQKNLAGNVKRTLEPKKIVDEIYEALTGKDERAFAILDNIVVQGQNGRHKELTPSRFRSSKQYGEEKFNDLLSRGMKHWGKDENGGFYYFGGKADNDKLIFMRWHPKTDKVTFKEITNRFRRYKIDKMRDDFVKKFGKFKTGDNFLTTKQAKEYFDKAFVSNVLWNLSKNGLEYNYANMKKMLGDGFINNVKNWNKRSQIWMTDSYAGDKEFYQNYKDPITDKNLGLSEDGNFKFIIDKDLEPYAEKLDHRLTKLLNTENPEHMDGAIIVRDDVINALNKDAGHPESGQNKSFIISPNTEHGALLGKYMFHAAGKQQSADMRTTGTHMIIQETAAKQMGTRETIMDNPNAIYELDPSHIKFNYSVKQGPEMLKKQSLKKQLLNGLVEALAFSPKTVDGIGMNDVVNDIFNTMIEPRHRGTDKANTSLDAYIDKLPTATDKELMTDLDKLDWENMGLGRIVTAMSHKGNQLFARKAYEIMLEKRKDSLAEEFENGDIDRNTFKDEIAELEEFNSMTSKMIQDGRIAARDRNRPENQMAIFLHNFVNDYRMKVLSSWVINQATKPKINNSVSARMRPYDRYLREDMDNINPRLKDLEKDDTIFFLDNAYRQMRIETESFGNKSLEQLWNMYTDKTIGKAAKAEIEEIFRSAVMRVPMDSISGTQILNFAGFTGRKGHGILLHSRAMKALGGADLDGDASYVYMGGKKAFKKTWKDVYEANKEEYYDKDVKDREIVKDAKDKDIIKDLILPDERKYDIEDPAATFAPNTRLEMSQAATDGRNLLGGAAVSPKQIMASAYNVIEKRGSDEFTFKTSNKVKGKWVENTYDVKITPKNSPKEKDYIRRLTRAMVGLSSDPMDYAGLKSYEEWWKQMYTAHFNIDSVTLNGKKVTNPEALLEDFSNSDIFKMKQVGIFGMMEKANSAYYGRDYYKNRNYTMDERQEMTSELMFEDGADINTMTPKIARLLHEIDYSDSPLKRLDVEKVEELYRDYKEGVGQYDELLQVLGRKSFKMDYHHYMNVTMNAGLHQYVNSKGETVKRTLKLFNPNDLDIVANDENLFKRVIHNTSVSHTPELLRKTQKEFKIRTKRGGQKTVKNFKWRDERIKILRDIRDKASAFLMKDLTTLITVRKAKEIIDKMDANERKTIGRIFASVDNWKKYSYLMSRKRQQNDPDLQETTGDMGLDIASFVKKHNLKLPKFSWEVTDPKAPSTAILDQASIDAEIAKVKSNTYTTKNQQDLLDVLMLGSLHRGDLEAIDAFEAAIRDKKIPLDEIAYRWISSMRQEASKTSLSRLGYNSDEVNRNNRISFLGDMADVYTEISEHRAPEEVRKLGQKLVDEPQKQENIEKGLPEYFNEDIEGFLTSTSGWEGIKKPKKGVKPDKDTLSAMDDITAHLKLENNKVSENFNLLVRSLLEKDISLMNKSDWFAMKNWFDDIRRGTLWQRLKSGSITKLSQRHYLQFPETINRELMKDEIVLMQRQGIFLTPEGIMKQGKVMKPTQYMDELTHWIGRANDAAIGKGEALEKELGEELLFLDNITDSEALHEIAIAIREHPNGKYLLARKDKDAGINYADSETYNELFKNVLKKHDYEGTIKDKMFTINIKGEQKRLRGEEVIKTINSAYTKFFKKMFTDVVTGDTPKDPTTGESINPIPDSLQPYVKGYYDKAKTSPKIDHIKFVHDVKESYLSGKGFPMKFGVDGIRKVAKSMMIEMTKDPKIKKELMKAETVGTRPIDFERYWPHMHFDKKTALESLKRYTNYLDKAELPPEQMKEILNSLTYRHHALTGDWNFQDLEEWKHFEVLENVSARKKDKEQSIDWFKSVKKAGPMFSRSAHMPGYSLERQVANGYTKGIVNNYFRQMSQIFGRNTINDFNSTMFKKFGKEQTEAWTTFMKLYVQGAMGNPDVVPEEVLNDPKMKMRGTPYAWWADNRVKDRINNIGAKLGLIKQDLPENLRGLDMFDIRNWSNLEAKFELASLLAHPKSVVNNIFGGTMHTIQSVGFKTWLTARNPKLLAAINPKWSSLQAIDEFVVGHGVLPEYLMSEYGLAREYHSSKNKQFIQDIARKLAKDPELSQESVRDLAKKRQITKPIAELAAKFMSVPERALRRDAFMAHYLHWYNKFGGAIKDFDHPILIELAKKGVKATQFLYSAPYRPMFARTALGKVMTRFQLWGWNAVRFRKEAVKQARMYGFQGPEAERATRMMQMDMFVFALGNAFAYSLFETAMPAPWNWIQDTSDWIFGDEKERNRAFFGQWPRALAPLQTVTPPILRLPISSMRAILEDDWERVANYYAYTMFPFGRIIRDLHGPNNIIENPLGIIDKWTGLPAISATRASKELREGPERKVPTPGDFY
jgi:hypothetical protein